MWQRTFRDSSQREVHEPTWFAGLAVNNQDGPPAGWVMTLGSAAALAQRRIGTAGPNALHTGDQIKVKFLPARDGSSLGFLKTVVVPDGRVIQVFADNSND